MPTRPVVGLVVAFWLATAGFVFHRDVWPLVSSSGPPTVEMDVSDEASQFTSSINWTVYRGGKKVGKVDTKMVSSDADDTFWVTYKYMQLELDFPPVRLVVPELTIAVRITRTGALREQTLDGKLKIEYAGLTIEAQAHVVGRVTEDRLVGECKIDAPVFGGKYPLGPVEVPDGQALSPLQPVNRLGRLHPGQTWGVREVDPLGAALAAMFRERFGLPERKPGQLIGRVSDAPEATEWQRQMVRCWVINYDEQGKLRARTWVRETDGKVLRQEAFTDDEHLVIERDD